MKKVVNILFSLFLLLNLLVFVQAQTGESPTASFPIPPKRATQFVAYSAEGTFESIQTLADGNKITRVTHERIFKDSKGRTRREMEFNNGSRIQKSITISGLSDEFEYYLNPLTKTISRVSTRPFMPNGQRITPPAGYSSKSEPLGTKIIEGYEARGTKTITTVAAGIVGNERPIETVSESWFSNELRITVLSKRTDPRMGDNTYQLKNIKIGEPDASLFTLPVDYKIVDTNEMDSRYFFVPIE